MNIHKGDFSKGIERVEKLFGQDQNVYDERTLTEIYDVVRHLDAGKWHQVVGSVVRSWSYKTLPNISAFEKAKNGLGPIGQRTRQIHEDCPKCGGGYGLRWFVYRHGDRFREGVCLCDCPNVENFTAPPHMTFEQARRLTDFQVADRPGAVAHMLEALNPAPPTRDPGPGDKEYPRHRQVAFAAKTPQETRDGAPIKKTSQGPQKPAAPDTQPASPPGSKTGKAPETLSEAAAQLARKLNGSGKAREQTQDAVTREKKDKMVQELNTWLSDDDKAHVPF